MDGFVTSASYLKSPNYKIKMIPSESNFEVCAIVEASCSVFTFDVEGPVKRQKRNTEVGEDKMAAI